MKRDYNTGVKDDAHHPEGNALDDREDQEKEEVVRVLVLHGV